MSAGVNVDGNAWERRSLSFQFSVPTFWVHKERAYPEERTFLSLHVQSVGVPTFKGLIFHVKTQSSGPI